jgi:hypothetical protein
MILFMASCSTSGCYEKMAVKVRCGMVVDSTDEKVGIKNVTVWGVGSDSMIYNNKSVDLLELELNPNAEETAFVFKVVQDSVTFIDTITFSHTNTPWFQSVECGCLTKSSLDSVKTTGTIFKSATIIEPEITNLEIKNVDLNI